MCTQNPHLKDFRQHPAQDRACCTHTAGYPPAISRFAARANRGPRAVSRSRPESGNGGFPDSRFPIPAESGIGDAEGTQP